ncbi:MAG: hypothetical protein IKI57_07310 [Clostridia bacterium]|nr:hypothetical protein [Clostridia bacterium]
MKVECKNNFKIFYSFLNRGLSLRVQDAFNFAQNNATEYFKKFDGDNMSVRIKDNAVWVVAKSRVHFYKDLTWLDQVQGETYTTMVKAAKIETETKFTNENGDVVFAITHQHCPLNMETRRIIRVDDITFPKDMELDPSLFEDDYLKMRDTFDEEDFVYEQKAYSQDIDYSNHVNNVAYIRFMMNALTNDYIDSIKITDAEIHYLAESKEGQVLRIYKKDLDNEMRFLIKEVEREIIRASVRYEKK